MTLNREDLDLLQAVADGEITNNGFWYRNGVAQPSEVHIRLRQLSHDLIEVDVQMTAFLPVHLTPAGRAALNTGVR